MHQDLLQTSIKVMERELPEENVNKILNCMTHEIGLGILHSKFHFAASNLKFSIVPSLLWIFLICAIKSSTTSSTKGR